LGTRPQGLVRSRLRVAGLKFQHRFDTVCEYEIGSLRTHAVSVMAKPTRARITTRVAASLITAALAAGVFLVVFPVDPVDIHVRWTVGVTEAQRVALERRFDLSQRQQTDRTTWSYRLANPSTANIRALIRDAHVEDTDGLDRHNSRPLSELSWMQKHRPAMLLASSATLGSIVFAVFPILAFVVTGAGRRAALVGPAMWSDIAAAISPDVDAATRLPHNYGATVGVLLSAAVISAAMAFFAGASIRSTVGALAVVYAGGYLVGSLLVARTEDVSFAIIRTIAGLMLTSVGFLLSLVLSLPWFVLPCTLFAMALFVRGRTAFAWPLKGGRVGWDGVVAGILVLVLVAPVAIAFARMAEGPYPPVFYNVDSPRALEEVHALTMARHYPPPSLSSVGVMRTYHYGVHAMAALVSRSSGLLPHHALFLIVLPLLVIGMVAAAVASARRLAPALPLCLCVPLLLIATPSLARSFSDGFIPRVWTEITSGRLTVDWINADYVLWGILSNEAQNTDFPILGSIAAVAAAPSIGWVLAAFLVGSSLIFKTTTGIALVGGFMLAQGWQAIQSRRYRPTGPMLLAGAVFVATFAAFYLKSFDSAVAVRLYPLDHLRAIVNDGRPVSARGLAVDALWLFLPALVVLTRRGEGTANASTPFLLMAVAPLIVVNTTHLVHVRDGGMGAGPEDWLQIPHAVPFLVHAFALNLASTRWPRLERPRRFVFVLTVAVVIAPVIIAAATYSSRLLRDPESGHEFADNRSIAQALAAIPTRGSIIVTNDLRYPTDHFGRDDRQIQIPALFGHQAFSVDFAGEPIEDRRELQRLLQRPEWSDAISTAARQYHWTHLLIRKDYVHPSAIPLTRIFENDSYIVYSVQSAKSDALTP
jgi:hypothetical protein